MTIYRPRGKDETNFRCKEMKKRLREDLLCEIQNSYENFICGMVFGFDTMVVAMTVKLKKRTPKNKTTC